MAKSIKRKNCTKTTSYNCGKTCINVNKACPSEGLKGQSVSILAGMKSTISAAKGESMAQKFNTAMVDRAIAQVNRRLPDYEDTEQFEVEIDQISADFLKRRIETDNDLLRAAKGVQANGFDQSDWIEELEARISEQEKELAGLEKTTEKRNNIVSFGNISKVLKKLYDQLDSGQVSNIERIVGNIDELLSKNAIVPFTRSFAEGSKYKDGLDLWIELLEVLGNL